MLKNNNVEGIMINIKEMNKEQALMQVDVEVLVHCREPLRGKFILLREDCTEENVLKLVDTLQKAA